MGTGLSAVVLSMFLAQAPPSNFAQWEAKWIVAGPNSVTAGTIALTRNPAAPFDQRYTDSRRQCEADLLYIAANGPLSERSDALRAARSLLFYYTAIGVDP